MHYSRIAQALQEISQAPRGCKADLAAGLLSEIEPDIEMLCPAVRLLLGELWPPWEKREMGIGRPYDGIDGGPTIPSLREIYEMGWWPKLRWAERNILLSLSKPYRFMKGFGASPP
jgi:hypothetical protein